MTPLARIALTLRFSLAFLLCALSFSFAQDKMMAIVDVQLQGEAKKYFSTEEKQYLSTAIRAQASQILGSQVEILSQAKFKTLVKANSEGCSEAGCFAGFIKEIGVDLGMQPTVSFAFGKLKMTLEVADSKSTIGSRTLSASPNEDGKNKLGEDAELAAKELFVEVAARMGMSQPSVKAPAAKDPEKVVPRDTQKAVKMLGTTRADDGMANIPAGCFLMGSTTGSADETPLRRVCLSAFAMDKHEVTQDQYLRVFGQNPSSFKGCGNCPVENVDWTQANNYCSLLDKRLPTEAEWEYAARAGSVSKWSCGDDESCLGAIAWYASNSGERTHPVGLKQPNAWGLFDMLGNVWEWTADWYDKSYYQMGQTQDPTGPGYGSNAGKGYSRTGRGGSWHGNPEGLRLSRREHRAPNTSGTNLGFRCAMSGNVATPSAGAPVAKVNLSGLQGESMGSPAKTAVTGTVGKALVDVRNGKQYRVVEIGQQTWMAQNLNVNVGSSWCPGNQEANCEAFGRLYDWKTALVACPTGWHLPSDGEWQALETAAGMSAADAQNEGWRGAPVGKKLKAKTGWAAMGFGTDELSFAALPGGYLDAGKFSDQNSNANFWTSTSAGSTGAWTRILYTGASTVSRYNAFQTLGFSVRCVRN